MTTDPFLNGNTTQVDMLGLPMTLTFNGDGPGPKYKPGYSQTRGFKNPATRPNILAAFKKAGKPFNKLVQDPTAEVPLRILSPYNGIAYDVFPKNQMKKYINSVWKKYQTGGRTSMTAKTTAGTPANVPAITYRFQGQVTGKSLTFDRIAPLPKIESFATFAKPSTLQAYMGWSPSQTYPPKSAKAAQAAALGTFLQAGLMRTTIKAKGNISACPGAKAYYKNKPVNGYSKIIHQYALKHKAYGFGYDDMCGQASDMQVFNPTSVSVTLLPVRPADADPAASQ
jgi:hypothetical protein